MKISILIDQIFLWVSRNRNSLMKLVVSLNWMVAGILLIGSYSTIVGDANADIFHQLAKESGEYAALLFIMVSIPGIARRFRYSHKLLMVLMMFRRQLGVLMYLFVLMHALILRIIPWVTRSMPIVVEPFVFAGSLANIMLFALFVTSNDWSVKMLGDWWNKIQNMLYVIVWCIFIHLALMGISIWTILIGITSIAQLTSHIYARHRRKVGR